MPTTQQLGNDDHEYGQMPLLEWVDERIANCNRIAVTKSFPDSEDWLEDAWYFEQVRQVLLLKNSGRLEEAKWWAHFGACNPMCQPNCIHKERMAALELERK